MKGYFLSHRGVARAGALAQLDGDAKRKLIGKFKLEEFEGQQDLAADVTAEAHDDFFSSGSSLLCNTPANTDYRIPRALSFYEQTAIPTRPSRAESRQRCSHTSATS